MKGKVIGLVGVIGSGKSYTLKRLKEEASNTSRLFIEGDFSEGIRQFIMNIYVGNDVPINGGAYAKWKAHPNEITLPVFRDDAGNLSCGTITGRKLLQRVGEYMKVMTGNDVWAKWTKTDVMRAYNKACLIYPTAKIEEMTITFGSVRFLCEAQVVFDVATLTDKEPVIIFCNHKSDSYELNDHVSEAFARHFVDLGYKDGQDITAEVRRLLLNSEKDERFSSIS
jgi:hypothetical protein